MRRILRMSIGAMILGLTWRAAAQTPSAGLPGAGTLSELARVLGQRSFAATAFVTARENGVVRTSNLAMPFQVLDGNVRTEMDLTRVHGANTGAALPLVPGLTQVVILVRPDRQRMYLLFPALKGYCEMASSQAAAGTAAPKVQRLALGREIIDGQTCTKTGIVITENSRVTRAVLWESLRGGPVKAEVTSGTDAATVLFRNVVLMRPAAALFELPAGFRGYANPQEMAADFLQRTLVPRR